MSIQWFPGHMAAARKKAQQTLARADMVIEVLDARIPGAGSNPLIRELTLHRQRPVLKVLNKADLADPAATQSWLAFYNGQKDVQAVALSCKKPGDAGRLPKLCETLAPHRGTPLKPLRCMIMGIPNAGKSTLINALLKRRAAKVGDEPAITREQQSMELNDHFTLIDTPGLMWPKIEHEGDGLMLAAANSIGRNAVIEYEVAVFLAGILLERYPILIEGRYGLAVKGIDAPALLDAIAAKRGLRQKGGAPDIEKAALTLLQDFRSGALGRISLETPQTRSAMLAHAQEANE